MSRAPYIILLLAAWLAACEKELDFSYHTTEPLLVIEGRVTNEGSEVLITRTRAVDDSVRSRGLSGAEVLVTCDDGSTTLLPFDPATGTYRSPMKGETGHSYQLKVHFEGRSYSATSNMPPVATILSANFLWQSVMGSRLLVYEMWAAEQQPSERNFYCYRMDRRSSHPNMKGKRQGDTYRWAVFDNRGCPPGYIYRDVMCSSEQLMDDEDEEYWNTTLYEGDIITFQLMSIDRSVYDYYASLRTGQNGGANPRSNISGGCLGYFAAMNISRTSPQVFHRDDVLDKPIWTPPQQ